MKFDQLRYFNAAAEEKSLTRAAELLEVSQPAIGLQIKSLEKRFGVSLLDRHARGVSLTPEGKYFHEKSKEILVMANQLDRKMKSKGTHKRGIVRIGIIPSLISIIVPDSLARFYESHPDMTLLFVQGFAKNLLEDWQKDLLDVAFINQKIETKFSSSYPLYSEDFKLIGNPEIVNEVPSPVPLEVLQNLPMLFYGNDIELRAKIDDGLRSLGLELNDVIEISSHKIRMELVKQKRRFCVAPTALFSNDIQMGYCKAVPIKLDTLRRTVYLVGPKEGLMSEFQLAIFQFIKDSIDENLESGKLDWNKPDQK
ncbi:MAG: LysR family transcriptional regulator [Rhodobacteraceae bacterium]|nr:LysR family transcriptional regulator [Paracoccaceae bacterium]